MPDIRNIQRQFIITKSLTDREKKLKEELQLIQDELDQERKKCRHIAVYTGWNGMFQSRYTSYCECLFCRKESLETRYRIDATNFNAEEYNHGSSAEERSRKIDELQAIAMKVMMDNPALTLEEFVEKMQRIAKEEEPKPEIKEEPKKTYRKMLPKFKSNLQ